jgi:hypothetical protein
LFYEFNENVPHARHTGWKGAEEPRFVLAEIGERFGILHGRRELQTSGAIDDKVEKISIYGLSLRLGEDSLS